MPAVPRPYRVRWLETVAAKAAAIAADVILLTHVRKVQVTNGIVAIEAHEKLSITDGDVSGH